MNIKYIGADGSCMHATYKIVINADNYLKYTQSVNNETVVTYI